MEVGIVTAGVSSRKRKEDEDLENSEKASYSLTSPTSNKCELFNDLWGVPVAAAAGSSASVPVPAEEPEEKVKGGRANKKGALVTEEGSGAGTCRGACI